LKVENSQLKTFHYFPPAPEEQRAFFVQFLGSLVALVFLGVLYYLKVRLNSGVLLGTALGVIYLLARSAWTLEKKARRSAVAQIAVGDDGLHLTDENENAQIVAWNDLNVDISGGRLSLSWPDGKLVVGARELENGMDLVRAVSQHCAHPDKPTNFIPLEPK